MDRHARARQRRRAGAHDLLRTRQPDGGGVEGGIDVRPAVGGNKGGEPIGVDVLGRRSRGCANRVGESEQSAAERRRPPGGSGGTVGADDKLQVGRVLRERRRHPDDPGREVDAPGLAVGADEGEGHVFESASHPEDIVGREVVPATGGDLDGGVAPRLEVDRGRGHRLHEKAADRVAPTAVRLARVAGISDLRLFHDDVLLLHQVGDSFVSRVHLNLTVGDRDPYGAVAPRKQVADVDDADVAVPAGRGPVPPGGDVGGRIRPGRPGALEIDRRPQRRQQEKVDLDGFVAHRRGTGERHDVDAVLRGERHEPRISGRPGQAGRVAGGPKGPQQWRDEGRLEGARSEPGVPELGDLLGDDRARRVMPGTVLERREPELPRDLESGVQRVGRSRAARAPRHRDELWCRLGPVQQSRHRVGDRRRPLELEGEPAESGEGAVHGCRRPHRRRARLVGDALLTEVLGGEHDHHVDRHLGVLGDDLGLPGGDDNLGVVELESEVHHVRGPHDLESEAGRGRPGERGAERLGKRLAIGGVRPRRYEGVFRRGCRRCEHARSHGNSSCRATD